MVGNFNRMIQKKLFKEKYLGIRHVKFREAHFRSKA